MLIQHTPASPLIATPLRTATRRHMLGGDEWGREPLRGGGRLDTGEGANLDQVDGLIRLLHRPRHDLPGYVADISPSVRVRDRYITVCQGFVTHMSRDRYASLICQPSTTYGSRIPDRRDSLTDTSPSTRCTHPRQGIPSPCTHLARTSRHTALPWQDAAALVTPAPRLPQSCPCLLYARRNSHAAVPDAARARPEPGASSIYTSQPRVAREAGYSPGRQKDSRGIAVG